MKKILLLVFTVLLFVNCKEDDISQNGCVSNLLPNYGFSAEINMSLPLYGGLQFTGNSVYINNIGVKGVYLYNTGSSIVAFEASDPAHGPSSCSRMSISGIEVTCECGDGNSYELLTGQQTEGDTGNCLRAYRVERNGLILSVYN